jgi:hypothetical protein
MRKWELFLLEFYNLLIPYVTIDLLISDAGINLFLMNNQFLDAILVLLEWDGLIIYFQVHIKWIFFDFLLIF